MITETVLDHFECVRPIAGGYKARCPAHEDKTPSLSIKKIADHLLIHCHAGCPPEEVVRAAGLKMSDLFDKPKPAATGKSMVVATYNYHDEAGNDRDHPQGVLGWVHRKLSLPASRGRGPGPR